MPPHQPAMCLSEIRKPIENAFLISAFHAGAQEVRSASTQSAWSPCGLSAPAKPRLREPSSHPGAIRLPCPSRPCVKGDSRWHCQATLAKARGTFRGCRPQTKSGPEPDFVTPAATGRGARICRASPDKKRRAFSWT